ncbi:hypothetical protein HPSA50_0427 [Helicobacter pylori SouthAfrica50]|uniref:Uncharacterized protein n=1 Tax=Helicobacter pylori SouthAfrica50 TaxID=1352357 RepID=T2SBC8_HELPX|nr:hypothetical protein HPSA50_0427 [Helicobacter pylori SouthAfrica50]
MKSFPPLNPQAPLFNRVCLIKIKLFGYLLRGYLYEFRH